MRWTDLAAAGFPPDHMTAFFVNPAGRHARFPIGGDRDVSPGATHAGTSAAAGAAIGTAIGAAVGVATLPLLGPGAAAAGVGAAAYGGALVGALGELKGDARVPAQQSNVGDQPEIFTRASGMLVAVETPDEQSQTAAIDVLREVSAEDIERAFGSIVEGDWKDFDVLAPVVVVAHH